MEPAARVEDEIAHGYGMLAMVGGALVGVAAGIAVVGAIGLTGGLAAVAIAGAVAGGGLAGDQIASGLETILDLPEPTTGVLAAGSPEMIYAKESPANARALLGEDAYNDIASRVGVPGGRGHALYEQYRSLPENHPLGKAIEEESMAYYDLIRGR